MTVFMDASALIAIGAQEPDALAFAECLEDDPDRLSSAVAVWEAMAGLCRSHGVTVEAAGRASACSWMPSASASWSLANRSSTLRPVPMPSSARGGTGRRLDRSGGWQLEMVGGGLPALVR